MTMPERVAELLGFEEITILVPRPVAAKIRGLASETMANIVNDKPRVKALSPIGTDPVTAGAVVTELAVSVGLVTPQELLEDVKEWPRGS